MNDLKLKMLIRQEMDRLDNIIPSRKLEVAIKKVRKQIKDEYDNMMIRAVSFNIVRRELENELKSK